MNRRIHWSSVVVGICVMAFGAAAGSEMSQGGGRYRIVEGGGYPVCIDFLQNLNAFPPDAPPMVCKQAIHSTHPEFTRPDWEEMEVDKNLKLIYNAERLLWRFTPTESKAQPFRDWKEAYRKRIRTGEAEPRLRRLPVTIAGRNETLIWYEPVADECKEDLAAYGVAGGPGEYIFVLRRDTGELQEFGGLIGTQGRTDVLLYFGRHLYFTTSAASFDLDLEAGTRSTVWNIGLHGYLQNSQETMSI